MGTTLVHFEANTILVNDLPRYRLYASCTEAGSLKDNHIFLHEIVDPNNALLDTFVRVLEVSDFDTDVGYKSNRLAALSSGAIYWRAASMTKYYEEVDVAVQAKQVLQDEINRLITDYVSYSEQYATSGEDLEFPTAVAATVQQYVDLYDTALTNYENSLTAQTTATVALSTAQTDYEEIYAWLEKDDALQQKLDGISDRLTPFLTATNTFANTQTSSFLASLEATGLTGPQQTLVSGYRVQQATYLNSQYPIGAAAIGELAGLDVSSYYLVGPADLAAAEATLAAAQTVKITADAAVQANYSLLEAAYEAVKAVCPSWSPDEPLPPRPPT